MSLTVISRVHRLKKIRDDRRKLRSMASTQSAVDMNLSEFFRESWHVLEPSTDLLWNWHLEAICLHVQEIFCDWLKTKRSPSYTQRLQNLIVNVPPGSAKSRIVSVCAPAWIWTKHPSFKMIFLSANPRVALRDSVLCRDLIESQWYQKTFAPGWALRVDQNAKSSYWNTAGGFRNAGGFDSRITGDRADGLFFDDPHDAEEANSESKRQHVLDRWDSAIRNRVNDPKRSIRVGIMQRLNEADLSGHVLKTGEWDHLCIPQEYEGERSPTAIGWVDPRSEVGELMFPSRFTAEFVKQERQQLGSYNYAGQHQQRPTPKGGGELKRHWFQYYQSLPPIESFDQVIQSWDCTFGDSKNSDYVVGLVLGRLGGDFYLIDETRDRMNIVATISAVKALGSKHPKAIAKIVEAKANGVAIIDLLKRHIPGFIPFTPKDSKIARLRAIAPIVESGNLFLPDKTIAPWIDDWVEEVVSFPNGTFDDRVDSLSMGISWLAKGLGAVDRFRAWE